MVKLVINKSNEYNLERREWQLPSVRNTCDLYIYTRPKWGAIFALSLRHITRKSWAVRSRVGG
jgi:hypothetical protein